MAGYLRVLGSALVIALGVSVVPNIASASAAVAPATSAVSRHAVPAASGTSQESRARTSAAGYTVRVASFNILTSAIRRGGVGRAHRAANKVQDTRSRVVSFQEVAADQLRVLRNRLPGYSFYPKRELGSRSSAIQLAWRRSEATAVDRGVIYRPFLGHQRAIPWVRLKEAKTGRQFYAIGIHNAPGGHERERDISTKKEIELIKRFERTGRPVFVMGDMNERQEFCQRVAARTNLVSMYKGTWRKPCPVYPGAGPDWMLGTGPGVDYANFRKRYNGISDHPMLTAVARVSPSK